ncbi:hypothetical protein CN602_18705 [Bacillus cereus]|uniref:hypothetical protein n=1 Tax=Bacillus cereus TaxID=1396 RepID=UPI000BEFC8BB|nr:hypothetical protein [Bacillus cereus]PEL99753.1 hypothetical protein CN602_18705 [Bacillus cereus]
MKHNIMRILSSVLVTGGLLVPTINAQASTVQAEVSTQQNISENWSRHDRFDYMVKLQRGQRSNQSPIFNLHERRNPVQFNIINESRFLDLEYKLYKMERNSGGPNRAVVIERGIVNRNAKKMFDERFQKGDYYLELECDRGGPGRNECEGRAFITIFGR